MTQNGIEFSWNFLEMVNIFAFLFQFLPLKSMSIKSLLSFSKSMSQKFD